MRRAIYLSVNGTRKYVGKVIDDVLYRNFPFGKAVLWQSLEVSMDKRLFDFTRDNCRKIVFLDTVKKEAWAIGIKKTSNHCRVGNYGEGDQVYFHKDLLDKLPSFPRIPFVGNNYDLAS